MLCHEVRDIIPEHRDDKVNFKRINTQEIFRLTSAGRKLYTADLAERVRLRAGHRPTGTVAPKF